MIKKKTISSQIDRVIAIYILKNTDFRSFFMTKNWVFFFLFKKLSRLHTNCIEIKSASWKILQSGISVFVYDRKQFLSRFLCADNSFPRFRVLGELLLVTLKLYVKVMDQPAQLTKSIKSISPPRFLHNNGIFLAETSRHNKGYIRGWL